MGQAAYRALIKASGTSTSFTDEPASNTSGNSYRIDDSTKQILDRAVAVVVEVGGTVVASTEYKIDYLFGIVTFTSSQTGNVTVTGNYIPTVSVAGANQYSVDITGDILDNTNFVDSQSNGGYRTRQYGMLDVSANISRFDDLAKTFKTKLENRKVVLLEIQPAGGTETIRGWFVIESSNSQGEISSLEVESLTFQLDGGRQFSIFLERLMSNSKRDLMRKATLGARRDFSF